MARYLNLVSVTALAVVAVILCAYSSVNADTPAAPVLSRITPSGADAQEKRQIVLQFQSAVAPVGKMERTAEEVPVVITPTVDCQWRWLNTTSLACQLGEKTALHVSTKYELSARDNATAPEAIQIRDALRSFLAKEYGGDEKNPKPHMFIMERARVTTNYLWGWHAPGRPEIRVNLNNTVSAESLKKHLFFRLSGGRRVPVELLSARIDENSKRAPTPEHDIEWGLIPDTELPLDSSIDLRVEPGIISDGGPEPSIEERVLVTFDTHTDFRFAGIRCSLIGSEEPIEISIEDAIKEENNCNPQAPTSLLFSSPVGTEQVKNSLHVTPALNTGNPDVDPWADVYPDGFWVELFGEEQTPVVRSPHTKGQRYALPLPGGLKANQLYALAAEASTLHDAFGRELAQPIDFKFQTSHRPPRMAVDSGFFSLESAEETHLPVAVQNVDKLEFDYDVLTPTGVKKGLSTTIAVDNVADVSYYVPLKIRSLLDDTTGAVQGFLRSDPSLENSAMCGEYRRDSQCFISGEVTPFAIHAKVGHFGSLVWVTRLADGSPVPNARVQLYREKPLEYSDTVQAVASATTDQNGVALLSGSAKLDPKVQLLGREDFRYEQEHNRDILKLRVDADGQMAYMPLVQDLYVEPRGPDGTWVSDWAKPAFGHIRMWGTTPQGVYKLGQTVQFKLFVRHQDDHGLVPAPHSGYSLDVQDPTGKTAYSVKSFELNEFGSYSGEFPVATNAPVGWYRFVVRAKFAPQAAGYYESEEEDNGGPSLAKKEEGSTWDALQVLVSDFTPATFHVSSELNGKSFGFGDKVSVTTLAKLHSGGAYTKAGTRITASIKPAELENIDPKFAGFYFGFGGETEQTAFEDESALDDNGSLVREFTLNEKSIPAGNLIIESAVRDDRGKYTASQATAKYHGRNRYVGVHFEQWAYPVGAPVNLKAIVIDENGKAATGSQAKILIKRAETKAARVKGPGNAYLTHYETEMVNYHECTLASAAEPVSCSFTPDKPGSYQAEASVTDTNGLEHKVALYTWVHGNGDVVWNTEDSNRLDIVPEKTSFKVGDRARFLIKNPFPGVRALVTVERYGIMKRWFQKLESSTPIVEVPVTADMIPGFYFSVVVSSPRVDKPLDENQVDLGKPTMRMGYARIDVVDPAKELKISVKPEKQEYRPGDDVTVDITVASKNKKQPTEVAVAVLDEAVFDLIRSGTDYFDPYKGFYELESLDVRNFNALVQLVGRRAYQKKGANSGGDGGADLAARSLFKFVSYWNPSLTPDDNGHAQIKFKAPDNLTGWRVLAMAVTKRDEMGLGYGNYKVNRPTEIQSALPNQLTVGDHFEAAFTVMNRTDKERTIEVNIRADGAIAATAPTVSRVTAKPFDRQIVRVPLDANAVGTINFVAEAGDAIDKDKVKVNIPVHPVVSTVTAATYGSTVEAKASEQYSIPTDVAPGSAKVSVLLSPSVITAAEGAFKYLHDYPYTCWEQQLTKAVMAAHFAGLKSYLPTSLSWPEAAELPAKTLANAAQFQAPNGGMTFFGGSDQYVDPYLSAYTALAFNWLRDDGKEIPTAVETKLHDYLLTLLRKDIVPDFYTRGMSATVRAVAIAALSHHGKITEADFHRFMPHVAEMSLFGKAYFLDAAANTKTQTQELKKVQAAVLEQLYNQAHETGGKYMFNESIDTVTHERLLTTPLRDNCAVLSAVLDYNEANKSVTKASDDIPFKLVRTISQTRKNRDHWENTQENVFCLQALIDYSRTFEKTPPVGVWAADFDGKPIGEARFKDYRDAPIELARALDPSDLGKQTAVTISREGQGRIYYSARLSYSPSNLNSQPTNAGIDIHREYSVERNGKWELLKDPYQIKQGELVRVDLYVSLPSAGNFVVVDDAIPGGLEPVNRDLGTASEVDAAKGELPMDGGAYWFRFDDWIDFATTRWSFYHQELRHDSARFYSDYLPPGNYHLAYTAQAIAAGKFMTMPVHAEEMYDPDVFGTGVPMTLVVE